MSDLIKKRTYAREVLELKRRIAELKEIVSVLTIADETGYVDGEGFVTDFNKITDEAREFLVAHNLEQQAKGIEWVLACRETNFGQGDIHTMMDKCNKLREQAKGGVK